MTRYSDTQILRYLALSVFHLPSFGEVGPVRHHLLAQSDLRLVVAPRPVEREPEHEGDLVRVHRPGPERPGGVGGPLGEIVHVDVVPRLGVPVAELHDGAGELPVPREPVHLLPVLDGVAWVEPVCVLELYRFPEGGGELQDILKVS